MSSDLRIAAMDRSRRVSTRSSHIGGSLAFPHGSSDCAPRPSFARLRHEMRPCPARPCPIFQPYSRIRSVDSFVQPAQSASVIMLASCALLPGQRHPSGRGAANCYAPHAGIVPLGLKVNRHAISDNIIRGLSPMKEGIVTDAYFLMVFVVGAGEPFFKREL